MAQGKTLEQPESRKHVGLFARLFLATTLLVSQMSLGAVACACPETPPTKPTASVQRMTVCPVSGLQDCACCQGIQDPNPDGAAKTVSSKGTDCKVSVSEPPVSDKWGADPSVEGQVAALSESDFVPPAADTLTLDPISHLVVPRIRPPDNEANGLRAPPAS